MFRSTETIVLIIFSVSLFLFYRILVGSKIPGKKLLFLSFLVFFLSNIFTVVEGYILYKLFNVLEHVSIFVGSVLLLISVIYILRKKGGT